MKDNKEINENKKNSKFKEFISWLKESWKVPRKRAGIKLLGYFIFFIVFFIIASISSRTSSMDNTLNTNTTTTTTTIDTESYSYKQKLLLENKHFINYEITINEDIYKINGSINEGTLEGYLEYNEGIKKVKLENSILYEIVNEESIVIENDLNLNYIDINNVVKAIKSSRAYIEEKDNIKTYTYGMYLSDDSCTYKVYTNEEKIYKIEIYSEKFNYSLHFDV